MRRLLALGPLGLGRAEALGLWIVIDFFLRAGASWLR